RSSRIRRWWSAPGSRWMTSRRSSTSRCLPSTPTRSAAWSTRCSARFPRSARRSSSETCPSRSSRSGGRGSNRCASPARSRWCETARFAPPTTTGSRKPGTTRRSRLLTLAASSPHDGRMPTYSDEGIVLRRIDYGEADRILTVLTLEHGKIGVIARGVRKSQSRLASRTDLFTRSRMQLARGRGELDVLTQAETVAATPLRSDARRAACASLCAELTDRVLESHHADAEIYALVAGALTACADPERDPRAATVWFAR